MNDTTRPPDSHDTWKARQVEQGRAAADRGDLIGHAELFEALRRRYRAPEVPDVR